MISLVKIMGIGEQNATVYGVLSVHIGALEKRLDAEPYTYPSARN
jgi:hypothetical protein